jgi:predicted RNA-binding Zn ribbon-like protein
MKSPSYPGPLRDEPLAVELHNTVYAAGGKGLDGLDTNKGLAAWLAGIADRLPPAARGADPARRDDFVALRDAVRAALDASVKGRSIPAQALAAINSVAAAAPSSPRLRRAERGRLHAETDYGDAEPADVALAAIAGSAIDLLGGPERDNLRACGAPGCVLMFLKDHPRRAWCSGACGNRARQARHYERVHRAGT